MKNRKHILLVLTAVCLVLSNICIAYAIQRYSYISYFAPSGSINNTSASCTVKLMLNEAMPSKTVITLEKSSDGGNTYKYEALLTTKKSSTITCSTTGSKTGLNSSYRYRLKAEVFIYTLDGKSEVEYDYDYIY